MTNSSWISLLIYLVAAPFVGGLLAGFDRILSARMQSRQGPPIMQPFYDVMKLWNKENIVVRRSQGFYIVFFLMVIIFYRCFILRRRGHLAGGFRVDAWSNIFRPRRV